MKCPVDDTVLSIAERQGVEIDYCPACRGVWLDRGELDKLLDRAAELAPSPAPAVAVPPPPRYDDGRRRDDDDDDRRRDEYRGDHRGDPRYGHKKKKKSSFLSEFFEFGD